MMSPSLTSTSLRDLPAKVTPALPDLSAVSALMPSLVPRATATSEATITLQTNPPAQHVPFWTCPKTGLIIPKTLEGNLKWRKRLLDEARFNDSLQGQLHAACAASP